MLQERLEIPERRACTIASQPRSTQRRKPRCIDDTVRRMTARMHELVLENPRFGYRRIAALLRSDGFRVNVKRIYKLWKSEGMKVPEKPVRKRRSGSCEGGITRKKALSRNHVWAWDFFHDRLADGRPVKWLACIDEFTRECILLEPHRSVTGEKAKTLLGKVIRERGAPAYIRSDNGPEFIAAALRDFLKQEHVETLYIEPGAPWQNGYAESFNARIKDELVGVEIFTSLLEARVIGGDWKASYNTRRPHSSLGYLTPAAFAAKLSADEKAGGEIPARNETAVFLCNG